MRSRSCAIRQFLPEVLSIFAIEARREGKSQGVVRFALAANSFSHPNVNPSPIDFGGVSS